MSPVDENEYKDHKIKCSHSFEEITAKLEKMERAMFGEPDLMRKGVFDMTTEMYMSITTARGGEKIFWALVRVASGIIAIGGAVALFYKLLKS